MSSKLLHLASSRRDFLALKVYVALCYYKLNYYDVSQEVLAVYLQSIPDSTIALNLKACNTFRLYNGKAAEVLPLSSHIGPFSYIRIFLCLAVLQLQHHSCLHVWDMET